MPTRNARHAEQRPRGRDVLFERVDVDLSFEVIRKFGEVSVESVDVVVDSDEVIFGVVEFVEAGMADEVVKMFGRDVQDLIIVVAGIDGGNECDRRVRKAFGKKL